MAKWNEVFRSADTDGSGTIDLDEFQHLVRFNHLSSFCYSAADTAVHVYR